MDIANATNQIRPKGQFSRYLHQHLSKKHKNMIAQPYNPCQCSQQWNHIKKSSEWRFVDDTAYMNTEEAKNETPAC